jgi:ATP-dependent DNA helicase HFM1/MER3
MQLVAKANIIVTTPEKWDSMTRVWKKHIFLLGSVNLLLVDEVHHVSEDRGAVLEAVVVRIQKLHEMFVKARGIKSS